MGVRGGMDLGGVKGEGLIEIVVGLFRCKVEAATGEH